MNPAAVKYKKPTQEEVDAKYMLGMKKVHKWPLHKGHLQNEWVNLDTFERWLEVESAVEATKHAWKRGVRYFFALFVYNEDLAKPPPSSDLRLDVTEVYKGLYYRKVLNYLK